MKLEKRDSGMPEQPDEAPGENGAPSTGKKPVIVYIMVLFIVAFLLMALSFLMHQRSNSQVLGELHSNVNALEELQDALDTNIQLQNELDAAQKALAESTAAQVQVQAEVDAANDATRAMNALYILQQQYAAKKYDDCQETLATIKHNGFDKLMPDAPIQAEVDPPQARYEQLKEAVEAKLAENAK